MSADNTLAQALGSAVPVVLVILLVLFCAAVATLPSAEADIDRDVHP